MRFLIALLCLIAVVQSTVTNVQENINTVERASPDYFKKVDSEISLNELIKKRHALEKRWGYGYGGGFGGNINNNNMGGFGGNINNNNMGFGGNINNNNMGWGKREVIQANEIDKIELNDVKRDVKRDFISSSQWHLNNLEAMKANLDEFKLTKRDFEEMDKMYLEDMKRFERDISKWNEKRERPINFELSQTELDAMKRDLDLFDEFESVKKIDKKDTVELTAQKTQKKDVKESIEKINKLDQIRRRREVTQANEIDKIELNDVKRDVKRDFISSSQWHLNNLEAMKANIYDFKLTKRDFLEMEKAYLDEMKRIEKDVSTWNEKLEVPDKRDVKRDVKRDFISSSQWHLNNLEAMKANLDEFKLEKRDWLNNLELN